MTDLAGVLRRIDGMTSRDAALAFACAGVPVFPCVPNGKRPLTPAGFHDATIDEQRIRQWFHRWPTANIGMPTGTPSGVDVVDVDVRDNGSGVDAFRDVVGICGFRDFARVRTPSGGMHAYFPTGSHAQPCWQAARAHIDFRGDGGYVLVPPSRLRVGEKLVRYRAISVATHEATPVDGSMLRRLIDPPRVRSDAHRNGTEANSAALAAWVSRLGEGERNHGLFWAACRLFDSGTTADEAQSALGPAAMKTGLGEREIATTIGSAWRRSTSRPAERSLLETGPHASAGAPRDVGPAI